MVDPMRRSRLADARTSFVTHRDAIENISVVAFYSSLSALFVLLFHFLMARYLGPQQYSIVGTALSILFTAVLCSSTIFFVITRFVTYHHSRSQYEEINYLVTSALKHLFAAGFLLFLVFLVASGPIAAFFNLDDIRPVVMLGFALWLQLLVPVYEAAFKGLGNLHTMGRLRVIENLSRWAIALVFAYLTLGVTSMIFALGLGTFVALSTSYVGIRSLQNRERVRPNMDEIWRFALPALLTTASLALLLNMDVIAVKHFFSAEEAGVYAAASFIAKIPFLISWIIGGVVFTRVTRLSVDGLPSQHLLRTALQWITSITIIITFCNVFFANWILARIFGPGYTFGSYLGVYTFAMGLLAIVYLLAVYHLGRRHYTLARVIPWFVPVPPLLFAFFHASPFQIVTIMVLVAAALATATIITLRHEVDLDTLFRSN